MRCVGVSNFGNPAHLPRMHHRMIFTVNLLPPTQRRPIQWITTSMDRNIHLCELPQDYNWKQAKIKASWSCIGGDLSCMDAAQTNSLVVGCVDKTIRHLTLSDSETPLERLPRLKWRGISAGVTCLQWCPGSESTHPIRF